MMESQTAIRSDFFSSYLNDALLTKTSLFEKFTETKLSKFKSKPRIYGDFDFFEAT